MDTAFQAPQWIDALTEIGGGYALMSGRRLCFLVEGCAADALSAVMAQIVGHPDRLEAVKCAVEQRQRGEAA